MAHVPPRSRRLDLAQVPALLLAVPSPVAQLPTSCKVAVRGLERFPRPDVLVWASGLEWVNALVLASGLVLENVSVISPTIAPAASRIVNSIKTTASNGVTRFATRFKKTIRAWTSGRTIPTGLPGESIVPIVGRPGRR